MKFRISSRMQLIIVIALFATMIAFGLWGCTKRDEESAKVAAGAVSTALGVPPIVGESLVGLALLVSHAVTAKMSHARGRRKERLCQNVVPKQA